MWDLRLQMVAGEVAAKAVIVDFLTPEERSVELFSRRAHFQFVPANVPYGATYHPPGFNRDVSVERVPIPRIVTSKEFEDDDPALIRTRDGRYWLAWVAYQTVKRDGYYYEGADRIMVAESRDGRVWSRPAAITAPRDHFRVSLAEDRAGRIWCVYGLQKERETGNFDLYAKVLENGWSDEIQLTTVRYWSFSGTSMLPGASMSGTCSISTPRA